MMDVRHTRNGRRNPWESLCTECEIIFPEIKVRCPCCGYMVRHKPKKAKYK